MPVYLDPTRRWECPSCGAQHVTTEAKPHLPLHPCPALSGLDVPYAEVTGTGLDRGAVRHRRIDREDYVAGERVRLDAEGRPAAAVRTERADGSYDSTVYAPTASATATS